MRGAKRAEQAFSFARALNASNLNNRLAVIAPRIRGDMVHTESVGDSITFIGDEAFWVRCVYCKAVTKSGEDGGEIKMRIVRSIVVCQTCYEKETSCPSA